MRIPSRLRRPLKIAGVIFVSFLLLLLIDQCWQIRRLNADAFLRRAKDISRINTTNYTSYVGVAGDRVYLNHWEMGRWSTILYWTPLEELPKDLEVRLRAGDRPWKSAWDRQFENLPVK